MTAAAWEELVAAYGGGPELADGDACGACLAAGLQAAADAQAGSAQRESVLRILASLDGDEGDATRGRQPQPGDYFVSKPWLTCGALPCPEENPTTNFCEVAACLTVCNPSGACDSHSNHSKEALQWLEKPTFSYRWDAPWKAM